MAAKDLPAIVEKAIAINGQYTKVAYVGHSQVWLVDETRNSNVS